MGLVVITFKLIIYYQRNLLLKESSVLQVFKKRVEIANTICNINLSKTINCGAKSVKKRGDRP